MKTRESIRFLLDQIILEAQASPGIRTHRCQNFRVFHTECILCFSTHRNKALALTAFARKNRLIPSDLLPSELSLLRIVGNKRINNMLKQQVQLLHSGFEMNCHNCLQPMKSLVNYKRFYNHAHRNGYVTMTCVCGYNNQVTTKLLKKPKGYTPKPKKKKNLWGQMDAGQLEDTTGQWQITVGDIVVANTNIADFTNT